MAGPRWLAQATLALCAGLVASGPHALLAQVPDCETFPPFHSKTDDPDPVIQCNDLTYTVSLVPFATETCFRVVDPLPADTTFQSVVTPPGRPGWTCAVPPVGSNGTVDCSGVLFQRGDLTVVARVDPGFSGPLVNVATVFMVVAPNCPPVVPTCTAEETTTVDVPVELTDFRVE